MFLYLNLSNVLVCNMMSRLYDKIFRQGESTKFLMCNLENKLLPTHKISSFILILITLETCLYIFAFRLY